jgi:hypothetical protein
MEEIKSKREEFGVRSEMLIQEKGKEDDKNANKKVVKFFSGKTEAVTTCKQCRNKGVRVESFFTYSVSLPLQPVIEFYYHFVPFYRHPGNSTVTPSSAASPSTARSLSSSSSRRSTRGEGPNTAKSPSTASSTIKY